MLLNKRQFLVLAAACAAGGAGANPANGRNYVANPDAPWSYLSDQVMGGVSTGEATPANGAIRLTGDVSTANNGGFIQVRTRLAVPLSPEAKGIALSARGNGERYYLHLRTAGTRLPWQFYQAAFETTADWGVTSVPFSAFTPSGGMMRTQPRPEEVISIGLVAYGRDHRAELEVRRLEIY